MDGRAIEEGGNILDDVVGGGGGVLDNSAVEGGRGVSDDDGRDRVAGGENNQGVHQSQLEGGNTPEIKFLLQIGFYNILIF